MLEAMIGPFLVLFILGAVLGIFLGIADKLLKVKVDERLETLITMLPGYNCGACGHPGCSGLAQAVWDGGGKLKDCTPLKAPQEKEIKTYLSTAVGEDGSTFDVSNI